MNPERWQEIERLYSAALELGPGERASFLEEACAGDEALRKEVDALLASRSGIDRFMENPAMEMAAKAFAQDRGQAQAMLRAGQTIAHYHIVGEIGRGGMGVVYRAEDTKLKRTVALKCLPHAFAADPERLARFEREARILASLNHPNVAAIHGLEESAGRRFLVLELVEGETLAQRVAKGPLPVQEALDVCRQIAEGLEAAHEKGIVHRDLKPANVKITPEGKVKVLDFGLAKAFRDEPAAADASHSPTLSDQMTRPGANLGTAAYVSPEQARGKPVDKRTDIWAFGDVLFECLTGKRAFERETVTETLAAILKGEPDWKALPTATPAKLKDLLRRCFQKDLRERLHDIADARIEIEEMLKNPATADGAGQDIPAQNNWRLVAWFALASLAAGTGVGFLISSRDLTSPPPMDVARFYVGVSPAKRLGSARPSRTGLAFLPGGNSLVFSAEGDKGQNS